MPVTAILAALGPTGRSRHRDLRHHATPSGRQPENRSPATRTRRHRGRSDPRWRTLSPGPAPGVGPRPASRARSATPRASSPPGPGRPRRRHPWPDAAATSIKGGSAPDRVAAASNTSSPGFAAPSDPVGRTCHGRRGPRRETRRRPRRPAHRRSGRSSRHVPDRLRAACPDRPVGDTTTRITGQGPAPPAGRRTRPGPDRRVPRICPRARTVFRTATKPSFDGHDPRHCSPTRAKNLIHGRSLKTLRFHSDNSRIFPAVVALVLKVSGVSPELGLCINE